MLGRSIGKVGLVFSAQNLMKKRRIEIGKEGLEKTHQDEFPETTKCCRCNGVARIGFVAHENIASHNAEGPWICDLHPNEGKSGYWLHDCCSVAVYFCKDCLNPTALYNQA